MGNLCGKAEADPFDRPGRTLGSAPPPQPRTAPVPAAAAASPVAATTTTSNKKKPVVGGPPRTLGGPSESQASSGDAQEARRKAAAAAEARAQTRSGGKLHAQLQAQKKDSGTGLLRDAGAGEARRREIEAMDEARAHN